MIVATYFGMFMPALRPVDKLDGDPRELQVRSRRAIDLNRLRERYMPNLGETIQLKNTDYQYRAYCTKAEWGAALAAIAADIDYTKFKDTPRKYLDDDKLAKCYADMWSSIFRSFPTGSIYDWKGSRQSFSHGRQFGRTETQRRVADVWKRPSELSPGERLAFEREPETHELDAIEHEQMNLYATSIGYDSTAEVWLFSEEDRRIRAQGHAERPWEKSREQIDHSQCTHAKTRNGRRQCRRDRKKS